MAAVLSTQLIESLSPAHNDMIPEDKRDELNNILSEKMGCATKVGLIDKNNMVFDMVI